MRASFDTDRTQVPTRQNSLGHNTHMDPLEEKKTNMELDPNSPDSQQTLPTHQATLDRLSSRQQYDDSFDGIDVTNGRIINPSNSTFDIDKDLEKGDEEAAVPGQALEEPKNPNLIEWDGPNDPENPMNWPNSKKWVTTIAMGMMTFCVTFASSVFSNATMDVAKLYNVSTEVATLGTSLFVLGFAVGPL